MSRVPYQPAQPPKGDDPVMARYVRRELEKVAAAIAPEPTKWSGAGAAESGVSFTISNPGVWTTLMTDPGDVLYQFPDGVWVNGVYTAPNLGYYDMTCSLVVLGFGQGNRDYTVGTRIRINGVAYVERYNSSSDDFACSSTSTLSFFLDYGDTVDFQGFAEHESSSIEATANASGQVSRASAD